MPPSIEAAAEAVAVAPNIGTLEPVHKSAKTMQEPGDKRPDGGGGGGAGGQGMTIDEDEEFMC